MVMMICLFLVVVMAMSANAGTKTYHVGVCLTNPKSAHAMDKYRCCWGDYSLKVVLDKGMLKWHKMETQPRKNQSYHQYYQTTYNVPMGHKGKSLGALKGFLVKYQRIQGEKYVTDHRHLGFFGIKERPFTGVFFGTDVLRISRDAQMALWPANLTTRHPHRDDTPYCVFSNVSDSYYTPNQHTVACMYNRTRDRKVNQMVKKAFPEATYFNSVVLATAMSGGKPWPQIDSLPNPWSTWTSSGGMEGTQMSALDPRSGGARHMSSMLHDEQTGHRFLFV